MGRGGIAPVGVVAFDIAYGQGAAVDAQVVVLFPEKVDLPIGRTAVEAVIDKDQREGRADHWC